MIVKCIRHNLYGFTIGKSYEVLAQKTRDLSLYNDKGVEYYMIINDKNDKTYIRIEYFISLEDFRDNQIESILQ